MAGVRWERIRSCRLYCYHLRPATFECTDECAEYFVSREAVRPVRVEVIDDAIGAMLARGAELRIVSELYALRDAVVPSTLQFSNIRMGDAFALTAVPARHFVIS